MTTPAGWYPAPDRPGSQRYWDGQTWTEHYHEMPASAPGQQWTNPGQPVGGPVGEPINSEVAEETGGNHRKLKIWGGVAAGVLVIGAIAAAFGGGNSASSNVTTSPTAVQTTTSQLSEPSATEPTSTESSTTSERAETSAAPTTTTSSAPPAPSAATIDGDGTFEVGKDIKPGLYVSPVPDGGNCYFARLKDDQDSLDSIIDNGNSAGQTIVQIRATDKYFETNGCNQWVQRTSANQPKAPAASIPGDGIYQVGVDIKPGKYVSTTPASGNCYYARLANLKGGIDGILANNNSSGQSLVTVRASDEFFETNGCENWTMR